MEATEVKDQAQKDAEAREPDATIDVFEDYFGFEEKLKWYFPDGKQWIEYQVMTEGQKAKFQKSTSKDLVIERASNNARVSVDQAEERQSLLRSAITDWYLIRDGSPAPFSTAVLNQWLEKANPRLVEDIEKAIRKANPWLLQDMTVEDIDREIESLQEMREVAVEREKEKGVSVSR